MSGLAKDLEQVFEKYFGETPAMAIAFTLEVDHREVHWVTNVAREDGIRIFKDTAEKMQAQLN